MGESNLVAPPADAFIWNRVAVGTIRYELVGDTKHVYGELLIDGEKITDTLRGSGEVVKHDLMTQEVTLKWLEEHRYGLLRVPLENWEPL